MQIDDETFMREKNFLKVVRVIISCKNAIAFPFDVISQSSPFSYRFLKLKFIETF